MKKTFYSNGKLLITGEYLVLDGAKALALPTRFGQNLIVENNDDPVILWKSHDHDGSIWFEDTLHFEDILTKKQFENNKIKTTLVEILHEANAMNPDFLSALNGYKITTELTFPKLWGLGTSSTLINNIAQWLGIDAYELLKNSFGGSGYDLACAQHDTAIIYQLLDEKPVVETLDFNPDFTHKIFFVYLNKKQSSKDSIAKYYGKNNNIDKKIDIINEITQTVAFATDLKIFAKALVKHETELSDVLSSRTIQETLFPDFDGIIKSLGAWGGDFVLSISKENPVEYFEKKGYKTIIAYDEMILS